MGSFEPVARAVAAYHEGERAVQARAGVGDLAARIAGSVHDRIPERAAGFLREAPVVVTTLVADGWPWPTPLAGLPGLIDVPDERTVELARPALLPDGATPRPGAAIGILALDPRTRRRARVNGRVAGTDERRLRVRVEEAYSNCQKYIQRQELAGPVPGHGPALGDGKGTATVEGDALTPAQIEWVRGADTFFIASLHPTRGADASHRGGLPGFVDADAGSVSWPDYPGNAMFNTLGNLTAYPRAALLFVDFRDGRTLRIVGSTAIEWNGVAERSGEGERRVTLRVRRVVETAGEFPLRFRLTEYSPHNPPVR